MPLLPFRGRRAASVALLGLLVASPAFTVVLYNGIAGVPPTAQGWVFLWNPLVGAQAVQQPTAQGMILDTTAARGDQAGWLGVGLAPLDRAQGFSLRFDLRVLTAGHASGSRAGLSIIALAQDARGLELGFWKDRVWVQGDDPLFVRAETAMFDTGGRRPDRPGARRQRHALAPSGGAGGAAG